MHEKITNNRGLRANLQESVKGNNSAHDDFHRGIDVFDEGGAGQAKDAEK